MAKLEREQITETTIGTTAELAALLGVSTRRIQQLTAEGILSTAAKGRYLLSASVQGYLAYRMGETLSPEELSIERRRREAETILKESKAVIARLEAEELEGNYHRSEDVEALTWDMVRIIKEGIGSLPGRIATDVAHSSSPAECQQIIKRVPNELLTDLSNYEYDPEKYAERVRERMQWREKLEADEDE